MKRKRLPKFKSAEQEARFWETHSLADYVGQMENVTDLFTFAPQLIAKINERARKRLLAIRLAIWEIEKTKEIAKKRECLTRRSCANGLTKASGERLAAPTHSTELAN